MRGMLQLVLLTLCVAACGADKDRPAAAVSRGPQRDTAAWTVVVPQVPLVLDTTTGQVLDVWPVIVPRGKQVDETRRLVERLQGELSLSPGFRQAVLLASGDGASLMLLVSWADSASAMRGRPTLAGWLRLESDTLVQRARLGTLTARVAVRRVAGTAPALAAETMVLLTRYMMKRGHSFGALASLVDSNLVLRVLHDTAAQGGATLAAGDSGVLYSVMLARAATALEPGSPPTGTALPFWAPFAVRDESLMAVVAVVRPRF